MNAENKELKNKLKKKFYEFEISGFEKYLKYLYQQLTLSENKMSWDKYKGYTQKQILLYEEKQEKTKKKLSKL